MNLIVFDKFYGGLADGDRLGTDGSFRWGYGLDYKSNPDAITANLALAKASSTNVTGLMKYLVYDPSGDKVYGCDDGGKIYSNTTNWTSLRTVANSTGQGLELYKGVIYYRQNTQIGTYTISTTTFVDDWKKSADNVQTATGFATIKAFLNLCCFANGRYLATLDDAGTFTYNKLTFPSGTYVRDLEVRGEYLAIAVNDNADLAKSTRGWIYYWDGTSSTYNFFNEVQEGGGISSIQANQDSVFIFAGNAGNIYLDTGRVSKIKRLPFVGKQTIYVNPGADCNFRGLLTFGPAGGTSTTVKRGVYEFGQPNINYPTSLNFSYPISTGTMTGTGVEVGAVLNVGPQIYVGWKDAATYGVDLLSATVNQLSVVYESRMVNLPTKGIFNRFKLFFKPLAANESIELKYDPDQTGSYTSLGTATHTADGAITTKLITGEFKANDCQFQIVMTGTTTMPTVTKLVVGYDEEGAL
jgi:hypothetical protein